MRGKLFAGLAASACLGMLAFAPGASADSSPPTSSLASGTDSGLHQPAVPPRALAAPTDPMTVAVPCGPNAGADLQSAVDNAASGDTLRLAGGCDYSIATPDPTSPYNKSALVIDKTLTILGYGATIERAPTASSDFRVFRIDDPGNLTLSHVTVRGGRATYPATDGDGGGFEINGTGAALSLTGVTVTGNLAYTGGGGIGNYGGTLSVTRSSLVDNSASNGGGGLEQGMGTATFENSRITGNTADASLFDYFAAGGGGIRMIDTGTVTLTNTLVTWNRSLNNFTFGAGIENIYGTVHLIRSPLQDNTASGIAATGGGLSNLGTFTASQSPITDNTAAGTSSGGIGGGLVENGGPDGPVTLTQSPVSHNTASGPGAAGGGIYDGYGPVNLDKSPVTDNIPDNCYPLGSVTGCVG